MMWDSSMMSTLLDYIVTARFDLMLFTISIVGYAILVSSRKAKESHKKVGTTMEKPQVVHADQGQEDEAAAACTSLAQMLENMKGCDTDTCITAAQFDAFLEDYPQYPFSLHSVQVVLGFCSKCVRDMGLADRLFERMRPTEESDILSTFINFYLDTQQGEKACDVFELNYGTFFDTELSDDMEWRLLMAASRCG